MKHGDPVLTVSCIVMLISVLLSIALLVPKSANAFTTSECFVLYMKNPVLFHEYCNPDFTPKHLRRTV